MIIICIYIYIYNLLVCAGKRGFSQAMSGFSVLAKGADENALKGWDFWPVFVCVRRPVCLCVCLCLNTCSCESMRGCLAMN